MLPQDYCRPHIQRQKISTILGRQWCQDRHSPEKHETKDKQWKSANRLHRPNADPTICETDVIFEIPHSKDTHTKVHSFFTTRNHGREVRAQRLRQALLGLGRNMHISSYAKAQTCSINVLKLTTHSRTTRLPRRPERSVCLTTIRCL